jgi:ATP-dependent Clp protease, protease subunit
MTTTAKTKSKSEYQASLWDGVFVSKPSRTLEWLGSVNHDNLSKVLGGIKELTIDDAHEEIQLMINSHGGATGIGMSFYDAMTGWMKPNLTTIGTGDVDSSGIIVFLSGKRRFVTKNTTMLFHLAGRTFGTDKRFSTEDMENILKEDKLKDYQYACVVSDATGGKFTPERVLDLMRSTTVLTAEEAVNMGLAHKVLG